MAKKYNQHLPLLDPTKFPQIGIFVLKNAIWQPWLKQKQMEETITKKGMKTVF
jgi:hypothetical protein